MKRWLPPMSRRNVVLLVVVALLVGAIVVKYRDTERAYSTEQVVAALEPELGTMVTVRLGAEREGDRSLADCDAIRVPGVAEVFVCPGSYAGFLADLPLDELVELSAPEPGSPTCPPTESAPDDSRVVTGVGGTYQLVGRNVVVVSHECDDAASSAFGDSLVARLGATTDDRG